MLVAVNDTIMTIVNAIAAIPTTIAITIGQKIVIARRPLRLLKGSQPIAVTPCLVKPDFISDNNRRIKIGKNNQT